MRARLWLALLLVFPLTSAWVLAQKPGGGGGKPGGGGYKNSASTRVGRSSPSTAANVTDSSHPNYHHAEEEGPVEFRSETILVEVPAVVTDKSGGHVHGLGRDDFQVLENGKEQKIASFEEIEAARTALSVPALKNGEFSNLLATGEAPRTITVIALDTVNTPFLDQAYGRKQIIRYLAENVKPDQVLGLVAITSKGLKVLHDLTADPKALVEALKKLNGEIPALQGTDVDTLATAASADVVAPPIAPATPGSDPEEALQDFILYGNAAIARMQQDRAIETTMRGFLDIAWSLSGVPGRKALVWATSGFPFYIDQPSAVPAGYLAPLYEQTMQALNDAQISVYPVDVRGLVNYSSASDVTYAPRGSAALSGPAFANSLAARAWLQNSTLDSLRDFAAMTGGTAFYNSNDIAGGIGRAADDSSSYYLLGYYLDTSNTKSGWRKLKVKMRKHDLEVRARNGFFVTNATVNPMVSRQTDMQLAVNSPFDSTGLGVTVHWRASSPDGDKKRVGFTISLPPDAITVGHGEKAGFDLDVFFVAIKNGVAANSLSQTIRGTPTPETLAKLRADGLAYKSSLELPPGQYTVRFVVRDNLSGRLGSVSAPLTVN